MGRFNMRRKRSLPVAGACGIWYCIIAFGSQVVSAQAPRTSLFPASTVAQTSPIKSPESRQLLQIGDEIAIKVLNVQELNETLTIAPDGRISALLVNDVQASGLTVEALRETLTVRYAQFYQRP